MVSEEDQRIMGFDPDGMLTVWATWVEYRPLVHHRDSVLAVRRASSVNLDGPRVVARLAAFVPPVRPVAEHAALALSLESYGTLRASQHAPGSERSVWDSVCAVSNL